jgi:hypothetical protein
MMELIAVAVLAAVVIKASLAKSWGATLSSAGEIF